MKKWLKGALLVAGIIGTFSLTLAGCHTKAPFSNSSEDILFNGGVVSVVGEHIIFSNSYKDDNITSMDGYNEFAKSTYLAYTDFDDITDKYTSPNVNKIKGEVTGFSNMYSFVYGNSVYYASPNKHQTSSNQNVFTYVSFFKSNFGGGDTKELFTTGQYDGTKAVVRALQHNNHAYLIVWDGASALRFVNLDTSEVTKIADGVTSVAVPREKETEWNGAIYYTKNKTDSYTDGNDVFRYELATKKGKKFDNNSGYTFTFVGRTEDDVFYTITEVLSSGKSTSGQNTSVSKTCMATAQDLDKYTPTTAGKEFYSSSTVSNVYRIGNNGMDKYEGYIFTSSLSGDAQVIYHSLEDNSNTLLLEKNAFSNILFTYADLVYYSTSDGISYKSVATGETKVVVSGMTIVADKVGYDYYENGDLRNIFFYAERVYAEDDETPTEERDTNKYLYMKDAMLDDSVRLVGKTVK